MDDASRLAARARLPEALVRVALERPRAILGAWCLVIVALVPGIFALKIETTTDSLLDRSGARWEFYEESQELFGGDEIVTVMLTSETPFDVDTLAAIPELSEQFGALPGVRRVDSLATVPLVEATADLNLSLEPALAGGVPTTESELRDLAERLANDRVALNGLVSQDGRSFGLNLVLESTAAADYPAVFAGIEAAQQRWPLVYSGVPVFREQASTRTSSELLTFVPITVGVVGLLLFLLFRSVRASAIALGVSGLAVWGTLGVMGLLGTSLSMSTVILPPVLLALGSAYCMHFLASAAGRQGSKELGEAMLPIALPVALSGLTTAIGFLSVSFVQIQAVRDVSAFGALGVLMLVAASLTAVPAALAIWTLPGTARGFAGWLGPTAPGSLVGFVDRNSTQLSLAWLALLVIGCLGISRLQVETDAVLLFPKTDPIRVAYGEIGSALSGISPMNVVITAPPGRAISEPGVLGKVDALAAHLEDLPDVGKVLSYADLVRQIHEGFNPDLQGKLPENDEVIEQYLLLLESRDYFYDLVTADHSRANVLLRIDNNSSGALLDVAAEAEAWWALHGEEGFHTQTTGVMFEFARSEDRISEGQIRGLFVALGAIALILLGIFGRLRLALLALIPNALPVAVAFGAMGILRIPLDAGTVFVGNLALGIAVDDSIHELSEYHRRRSSGEKIREAIEGAFRRVLRPLVFTTAVVACGFLVLGVSSFTYTRNLGLLTAGVMVLCLLADLFLLPVLLLRWGAGREGNSSA